MKRFILIWTILSLLIGCQANSNTEVDTSNIVLPTPSKHPYLFQEIDPSTPTPAVQATLPLPPTFMPVGALDFTDVATSTQESFVRVPVLLYHHIAEPPSENGADLFVSPEVFEEQIAYLLENSYQTVDFYQISDALTGGQALPEKPILLTFDDGYLDAYETAFPLLKEAGFIATFFIVTDSVEQQGLMTWAMIEEMAEAGMRMEPHGRTPESLPDSDPEYLLWQVSGSQTTLATHLGYTPRYFAYPNGAYDDAAIQVLQELDFKGALTTIQDDILTLNGRYEWPRLYVSYNMTLVDFRRLIEPGEIPNEG